MTREQPNHIDNQMQHFCNKKSRDVGNQWNSLVMIIPTDLFVDDFKNLEVIGSFWYRTQDSTQEWNWRARPETAEI